MNQTKFLFDHMYGALVGKVGKLKAAGYAQSTVQTYIDGAYDDLDTLIRDNISCALGVVTREMLGDVPDELRRL